MIKIQSASHKHLKMPWKKAITVGRAYDLLRNDLLEHLEILQTQIGYEYIRFHAIFHDDMNVYKEDAKGNPIYQWHQVDKILDSTLKLGLRHIIELNPMPAALASGSQTIFTYKMNCTPPKSYEKWEALVRAFVLHLCERYGCDEISKWYFETWNEPDLPFWSGSREEYYKLYAHSSKAVKSVNSKFRTGGPATSKGAWVAEFIEHCHVAAIPLDFISTHQYPQDEYCLYQDIKDSPFQPGMFFIDSVKKVAEIVKQSPLPHLPVIYTEWNTQSGKTGRKVTWTDNEFVDNLYAAAMLCHICAELDDTVDCLAWWTASDIFEEIAMPAAPFSSGYGLLTMRGIPKASCNAFKLLAKMNGRLMPVEFTGSKPACAGIIACCDSNCIRLLIWNHCPNEQNEKTVWRDKIDVLIPDAIAKNADLQGISAKIAEHHGSAYETWRQMGSPLNLTKTQEQLLEYAGFMEYKSVSIRNNPESNTAELEFELNPNEVMLVEIFPAGPSSEKLPEGIDEELWNRQMSAMSKKQ